jgi:hypothetical protein
LGQSARIPFPAHDAAPRRRDQESHPVNCRIPFLVAALLALGACASSSTKLGSTWADPSAGPLAYKKILVAFQSGDKGRRVSAEVRMKQRIPGAVSSNTVFLQGEEADIERVKARIRELEFDAVVVMRVIAIDKEKEYVPPSTRTIATGGPGMYGYWQTGWVEVYDPGYTKEKTVAVVDTELYQVEGEKLIWSSHSNTLNPKDVPTSIDGIIDSNAEAMRKQGLLKR